LLSAEKKEKVFEGNDNHLKLIISNLATHQQRDLPEPVGNFTDAATIKEARLKKFLHYVDKVVSQIFIYYPLPVFVMATKKTMGYFQNITKHRKHIAGFVHGNFENATEQEILKALEPILANWNLVKRNYITSKIKIAEDELHLASGIQNVWLNDIQKA